MLSQRWNRCHKMKIPISKSSCWQISTLWLSGMGFLWWALPLSAQPKQSVATQSEKIAAAKAEKTAITQAGQTATATATSSTGNLLEAMEETLVKVVREAGPAVVTIEGRLRTVAFTPPKFSFLPSPPNLNRVAVEQQVPVAKRWLNSCTQALREARKNKSEAEKDLAEAEAAIQQALRNLEGIPTTGSGFLVQGGYVVTTAEVAEGLSDITIEMGDGRALSAEWTNADRDVNVAVLKVSGVDPSIGLKWGDSARVLPGSFALTIGNQAGFANSVALGLISGIGRSGKSNSLYYHNLIQFQGAVGAGGSGGHLLNSRGEVVGMIVATPATQPIQRLHIVQRGKVLGADGQMEAPSPPQVMMFNSVSITGFAMSSEDIKPLFEILRERRKRVPVWLGIDRATAEEALSNGVVIRDVYVDEPADKAGLQPDDIIIAVNGKRVRIGEDLGMMLRLSRVGEPMRIAVRRGKVSYTFTAILRPRPTQEAIDKLPRRKYPFKTGNHSEPPAPSIEG